MRTDTLHPVTDYVAELFQFVVREERFVGTPYFDTARPPRATIGYGFNIEVTDYLLLVLEQMGIVNDTMTDAQKTTIRNEFTTAINNTPDGNNTALITNLNQVASRYGVTTGFSIDATQGRAIFNDIVDDKEGRLDALLNNSLAHNSKEYVAVMSLFYNREDLIGPKLTAAITNDNRSEAWFEIRYNSNFDRGHASRRYRESDMFNLYDNGGFSVDECKEVMRMYKQSAFSYQLSA